MNPEDELTKEDIESFKFKYFEGNDYCSLETIQPYGKDYLDYVDLIYDHEAELCEIFISGRTVFYGKIKTKEELGIILKQVGYIK